LLLNVETGYESTRFLKQIGHHTAKFYVSAVLRWVAFSSRQINIFDLEDTLVSNFSNPEEFVYDPTRRGENADRVCKMLEGLVVKEEQNYSKRGTGGVVSLTHASVKDYLLSEKIAHKYSVYDLRAGSSHRCLAQTCLGYLLHFTHNSLTHDRRYNYPLGEYAARNWYYHLHRSDDPALLSPLIVSLLQDGSNQYATFYSWCWSSRLSNPCVCVWSWVQEETK
jgi:hypothetical protein